MVDGPLVQALVNARLLACRKEAKDIKTIETNPRPDAHQKKREILKDTTKKEGDKVAPPSVLFVDELSRPEEVAAVTGELLCVHGPGRDEGARMPLHRTHVPFHSLIRYALENRGKPIPLSYEPSSDFTIPHNFFLIATMNHLDANVRKLDTAIEQRFFQYKLRSDGEDPFYSPYDAIVRFMRRHEYPSTTELPMKLKKFIETINTSLGSCHVPERLFLGPRFVIKWADMWQKKEDLELLWFTSLWPYLERCIDDASELGDDINRAFGTDERKEQIHSFKTEIKEYVDALANLRMPCIKNQMFSLSH